MFFVQESCSLTCGLFVSCMACGPQLVPRASGRLWSRLTLKCQAWRPELTSPSCDGSGCKVCCAVGSGVEPGGGCGIAPSAALAQCGSSSATAPSRWPSSTRIAGATWLATTLTATVVNISLLFLRRRLLTMSATARMPSGTRPMTAAAAMTMPVTSSITEQFWRCCACNDGNLLGASPICALCRRGRAAVSLQHLGVVGRRQTRPAGTFESYRVTALTAGRCRWPVFIAFSALTEQRRNSARTWSTMTSVLVGPYVACQEHGTTLRGFLPRAWDHLVASDGTTRRVGLGVLITSGTGCLKSIDLGVRDGVPGGGRD
jgi:hypothetical protein